jgi:hypothetical protein
VYCRAARDSNRVAVPLTGVRRVETRGISAGRTALFVGGTFLGFVAVLSIACSSAENGCVPY